MSIFAMIGGALLALGFAAGAALLAHPLGLLPAQASGGGSYVSLWLFFLCFVTIGFTLYSFSTSKQAADVLLRVTGVLLLAMSLAAAVGLFLSATGFVNASGTVTWWLIFVGGIPVGATAMLMGNRASKD
jgi:hypothetical protein